MATGWDACISYAHADSERTAIALQRGLERFARPWYQRRAIGILRNSAMSTNPGPAFDRAGAGLQQRRRPVRADLAEQRRGGRRRLRRRHSARQPSSGAVDLIADLGSGSHAVIETAGNRTSTGSSQRHQPITGPHGLVGFPTRAGLELFDLTTQRPIATVPVPPALVAEPAAYAFSADGSTLIAASFGDTTATALVRLLPLGTDALVRQICATAGGTISTVDWSRLVGDQPPEVLACR